MASCPVLRRKIVERLKELRADGDITIYQLTLEGVKKKLGVENESNSSVDKALRSLHNRRIIRNSRPAKQDEEMPMGEIRTYKITLLMPDIDLANV